MKKIVVLASGQGLTLQALIDACQTGQINAQICAVICNKAEAFALQRAQQAGIPAQLFLRADYASNGAMDEAIGDYIQQQGADLILLAGYMKLLSPAFTQRFAGKILNIHPSLLPKYPGLNTYQRALEAKEQEHGTSIHFVNEEMDGGAIVLQARVPIFAEDSVADVEARVKQQELRIYPLVAQWFVEGRLQMRGNVAYLDDQPLGAQGYAAD